MPRVFITQVPHRRAAGGKWEPVLDVSPAEKFGECLTMLPPQSGWMQPEDLIKNINIKLDENNFSHLDYLMPLGSPTVMVAAGIAASKRLNGRHLKLLIWDRQSSSYFEHTVMV